MAANEGVPKGDVFEFTMESKDSKIYPGIAREPNTSILREFDLSTIERYFSEYAQEIARVK